MGRLDGIRPLDTQTSRASCEAGHRQVLLRSAGKCGCKASPLACWRCRPSNTDCASSSHVAGKTWAPGFNERPGRSRISSLLAGNAVTANGPPARRGRAEQWHRTSHTGSTVAYSLDGASTNQAEFELLPPFAAQRSVSTTTSAASAFMPMRARPHGRKTTGDRLRGRCTRWNTVRLWGIR